MNYKEICEIAKKEGMIPDFNASSKNIDKLKKIETVCFQCYDKCPNDAEYLGAFLYHQSGQPSVYINADAICCINDDGAAVIGVSYELLNCGSKEFCEVVFIHEMAHLTEIEHNETFMDRYNQLEYEYFMRNRRADGAGPYRPTRKAHKW